MSRVTSVELRTWRTLAELAQAVAARPAAGIRDLRKAADAAEKTVVPSRDPNDFALCALLVRACRVFADAGPDRRTTLGPGLAVFAAEVAALVGVCAPPPAPPAPAPPAEGERGFRRDLFG